MGSARLIPGLVSITFRQKSFVEVIDLCELAQLQAVEWGADVHCPPRERSRVKQVATQSMSAGLKTCCYGSYYRAGETPADEFHAILEAALILDAPLVRVWAGARASAAADGAYRSRVEADLIRISGLAVTIGKRISLEYHGRTLTDDVASTARLLALIPSLVVHWQPPNGLAPENTLASLRALGARLSNLHIFAWEQDGGNLIRQPLATHSHRWQRYLEAAAALPGDRCALLEFVREDSPEQFVADARTLHAWLGRLSGLPQPTEECR